MAAVNPFNFVQTSPSDTWNIVHNLGVYPVVDVVVNYNGVLTKIIPLDIIVVDVNNVVIKFTKPYSGQARLM